MPEENAIPWTGEGLPPVGVACDFTSNEGRNWRETEILFADSQVVLLRGYELFKVADPDIDFRPIRPPEQIAPDEREKAVLEIAHILISNRASCAEYHQARLIYDAGYRKQVTP